MKKCPECPKVFNPDKPEQIYCSRRCARLAQAHKGIPSIEDKKALFADAMMQKFDEIFKLK